MPPVARFSVPTNFRRNANSGVPAPRDSGPLKFADPLKRRRGPGIALLSVPEHPKRRCRPCRAFRCQQTFAETPTGPNIALLSVPEHPKRRCRPWRAFRCQQTFAETQRPAFRRPETLALWDFLAQDELRNHLGTIGTVAILAQGTTSDLLPAVLSFSAHATAPGPLS